jgi:hypothetical protein
VEYGAKLLPLQHVAHAVAALEAESRSCEAEVAEREARVWGRVLSSEATGAGWLGTEEDGETGGSAAAAAAIDSLRSAERREELAAAIAAAEAAARQDVSSVYAPRISATSAAFSARVADIADGSEAVVRSAAVESESVQQAAYARGVNIAATGVKEALAAQAALVSGVTLGTGESCDAGR